MSDKLILGRTEFYPFEYQESRRMRDLLCGIDRLAQAQQVVTTSLDTAMAILKTANELVFAWMAATTTSACKGCRSNKAVVVNGQRVRLHIKENCLSIQQELL